MLDIIFAIDSFFFSKPSRSIIILVKIVIFSFTTFITFFIDLLVSVVFPLITGIVLGVSLLLWRLVFAAYRNNLTRSVSSVINAKLLMQRNVSAKKRIMTVIKALSATSLEQA